MPGARFVDPKILARIGNLELLARTVVDGFINGLHRAPYFGASIDFAEHRGYVAGDDIRRVDWRLYARTDRYYIKQYEADTNANFCVILDISKSMSFGSRGVTKLEYASYLGACLAYLAHKQRDRVGIITFDSEIVSYVPPSAKHFDVLLHTMRSNHFEVIETWKSEKALENHAAAAHTKKYRDDLQAALGSPLDERIYKSIE